MENISRELDEKAVTETAIKIITDFQILINSDRVQEALEHITELLKLLILETNHSKIRYIILKVLNNIMARTNPKLSVNACPYLNESLVKGINDINFEKQVILELQTYVKDCKKNKNYSTLPWALTIIYEIIEMQKNRNAKISTDLDIYQCGIKGIKYIPSIPQNNETDQLRENIENHLQRIRR